MMNRWTLFGTALVLVVTAYAGDQPWYRDGQNVFWRLKEGQTFVAELDLQPGASRPVRIKSDATLWVGFKAKISFEQFKDFSQKSQMPIKLQQDDDSTALAGASSVATRSSGGHWEIKNQRLQGFKAGSESNFLLACTIIPNPKNSEDGRLQA